MSGRQFLALAVIALQQGNQEDCLKYMSKAGEFGDDLTQFVSEVMQPAPTAVRNDGSTPQAENTLAPSLAATASATDFISLSNRVSRQLATASYLDAGDELEGDDFADEAFDEDDVLDDDEDTNGVDEDLENEDEELEEDEEEEAVASADVQLTLSGPIRYKC